MTATSNRPLPLDLATLRGYYYPLEPETSVSRGEIAIRRLDQVIAAVRQEITQRDEQERQLVSDVVSAAHTGDKIEPVALRMVPGDRPILEHRLAQLQNARTIADRERTRAQYADPVYLRWKATCEQITEEWRQCMYFHERDSEGDRLQRLTDFALVH